MVRRTTRYHVFRFIQVHLCTGAFFPDKYIENKAFGEIKEKRPGLVSPIRAGKVRTMKVKVRKCNGITSIRLQIGALAITVEFPL